MGKQVTDSSEGTQQAATEQAPQDNETPHDERDRAAALDRRRKQRPGAPDTEPALVQDIREAVTCKHNQIFMLTSDTGDIVPDEHGFGLYYRDTQYLDQLELRIAGNRTISLLANAESGSRARFQITNRDILLDGAILVKENISVQREYALDEQMRQHLSVANMGRKPVQFDLTMHFASHFTNMFVVRGAQYGKRGTLYPPQVIGGDLLLAYDGADGHHRAVSIHFDPQPDALKNGVATYVMRLRPQESRPLAITLALHDIPAHDGRTVVKQRSASMVRHQALKDILAGHTLVQTDNPLFARVLARSFEDLRMLAMVQDKDAFLAAGVPWYVALFGRDSCITAFEILAYQPDMARDTLRVLARYQGTRYDAFQDEAPGKIPHELRVGEKANLREVPQVPYYGTVDATPWFLILLAEYVRWTGNLELFYELESNVERALQWVDANPGRHATEFLAYNTTSAQGFVDKGWKDSGGAIVNEDGTHARAPIALCEVQGYAYRALLDCAYLYHLAANDKRAAELEQRAAALERRFNDQFWMEDKQFYALALQAGGRQARVIASNAGQTLFTGIAPADRAAAIATRLMRDDMFSGWGVRTLSANEVAYNPMAYQVGSVWPHDNALIALGLHRMRHDDTAQRIFGGIFEAATFFPHYRLPEVFDGFSKSHYAHPVRYPVACSPQAWAAGAVPLLLQMALGLEPDAPNGRLRIRHPHLPPWLNQVTVRALRVGQDHVDLEYRREGDVTLVAAKPQQGHVRVQIEY